MRVRSRWFVLSGALGGLVGFVLMEGVQRLLPGAGTRVGDIWRMAIYFAGFGLAVGAGLGLTEGVVLKKPGRAVYGLIMGLLLGALGGFAGGAVGQFIYGLVPVKYASRSTADIAIALDSSGSMGRPPLFFFNDPRFGHDVHGERRTAAKNLIDQVAETDRIAVVDFDTDAKLLYPLDFMSSASTREAAQRAVDQVDDEGGTNLSAGLDASLRELLEKKTAGRKQYVIFLTDGQGFYSPDSVEQAKKAGITIYTVGLSNDVDAQLLRSIAEGTGGRYYPVADASSLTHLFQQIFTENIDMTSRLKIKPVAGAQPMGGSGVFLLLRILSWAVMGLAIGLGQGVRENTREDLWACSLGGFLGGAVGGALFNPVTNVVALGGGLAGRALADIVVGACIGGSMRLAQEKMVEASGRETTTLLAILPKKGGLTIAPPAAPGRAAARRAEVPPASRPIPARPAPELARPIPAAMPAPAALPNVVLQQAPSAPRDPVAPSAASPARPPLSSFEAGNDRERAMALAYRSGGYSLREIAEHFGVAASAVKRAADQHALR